MNIVVLLFAVTVHSEVYQIFNVGSTGVTYNDFVTVLLLILLLKITIWDGKELKLAKNPAILFYVLFLLATFTSGLFPLLSGDRLMIIQYFKSIMHFHFTFIAVAIILLYNFENETWNQFIKIWLILSIGINIFGVYQIIARAFDLPFAWIELTSASFFSRNQNEVDEFTQLSLRFEGFFRATSIFSEPSALAGFNGLTLIFATVPSIKGLKPFLKSKALNNTVIVLTIMGLLLAFSLTGVAIVALFLLTLMLTERLQTLTTVLKVLPFIIIFVISTNMVVESYSGISILELFGKRFGTLGHLLTGGGIYSKGIEGESVIIRGENFTSLFNIWQSSPITGVGLGTTYLSPYSDGWAFSDTSFMAALGELGLVGAIPYLALFITIYVQGFRFTHTKAIFSSLDANTKRLFTLIVYIMCFFIVTNFISGNNLSNIGSGMYIGLMLAIFNNYYIDYRKEFYVVKFVNKPLKERFTRSRADLKSTNSI